MNQKKRWVLLKHVNSPDDINCIHFDLLLEDAEGCRTWRLNKIPDIDGSYVKAIRAPIHKLAWLQKTESAVSGGRGWASRVEGGIFTGNLPISLDGTVQVMIFSHALSGRLEIKDGLCRISSQ
tara:strand:- start:65706 stop:66074 length:369 start_codon:yes stop_codon:yes gene_type:complete